MANIILFDLDNTLLMCDSDHAWGQFLVDQGHLNSDHYEKKNNEFYQDYQSGQLDIHAFLAFALKPLTEIDANLLINLRTQFLAQIIPHQVAPNIHANLKQHQEAGERCLIITATNDFITQPIADFFQVPLIATRAKKLESKYTGSVEGLPCFGPHKIDRLEEWLKNQNIERNQSKITFYSDSINDLPLLKYSDHPIAVNPDENLLAIAQSMQWPSLFHPKHTK